MSTSETRALFPGDLFAGEKVRLAAMGTPEYFKAAARWMEDAEYQRMSDGNPAIPRGPQYLEEDLKRHSSNNLFWFSIRTLADDLLIGDTGLWVRWNHQTATFGIGIGEPAYLGKGYGTDAVRVVLRYGFRELGLWRVQLGAFSYNARAIRSYEKAGFRIEAVERAACYRDGQRTDHVLMGILRPEWEALQG